MLQKSFRFLIPNLIYIILRIFSGGRKANSEVQLSQANTCPLCTSSWWQDATYSQKIKSSERNGWSHTKGTWKKETLAFCLLALTLTGKFIYDAKASLGCYQNRFLGLPRVIEGKQECTALQNAQLSYSWVSHQQNNIVKTSWMAAYKLL